jgi:hypothetical protein
MPGSIVAIATSDAARHVSAALLLASLVAVSAGCSRKSETTAAAPKPQAAASAGSSVLDPQATIDNVKRKLDAAAEQDRKRRDQIEEQTK